MNGEGSQSNPYPNLGQVIRASHILTSGTTWRRARVIVLLLAISVALMMTGYGIIMPVFARRLAELDAGVEVLGFMTTGFAVGQLLGAPLLGALADRVGRRPLVLLALATHTVTNIAYLLAASATAFVIIRTFGGALTAGLFPSAMGVVSDLIPEKARGRWIGIVIGGYGAGYVLGPVVGGILYDGWGFASPFVASAVLAGLALVAAAILVPETRTASARRREELQHRRAAALSASPAADGRGTLLASLPRPVHLFVALLFVDFLLSFAFAFFEPQMVFYVYDELAWTTTQFGLAVGVYGLAMIVGQIALGQSSDRLGRKPVLLLGILLNTALYGGFLFFGSFPLLMVVAAVSGLGLALTSPALNASYLDLASPRHRSRVMGIKSSWVALGSASGPLVVALVSGLTTPKGIFFIASMMVVAGLALALFFVQEPREAVEAAPDMAAEIAHRRALAAQASLQGIVLRASRSRSAGAE